MSNFLVKANQKIVGAAISARMAGERAKEALMNRDGQGTLDIAVTVLVSIVLGALILAGLYLVVNGTVLPTVTQKIKDMFNYSGTP